MANEPSPARYDLLADDELLRLLKTEDDRLPRAAVDEFVRRGERMIEPLTAICRDGGAWRTDGSAFWAAVHAAFILAAVGGERAVPGLMGALRHAQERHVEWVTEALASMFGAVGPPAVDELMRVISDEGMSSMVRWLAATCLGGVAARHEAQRDRVLDFLRDVAGRGDDCEVRGGAGMVLLDFLRPADRKTLRNLGKELDEGMGGLPLFVAGDVDEAYEDGATQHEAYTRDWLSFYDADEIAGRQERWKGKEEARAARQRDQRAKDDSGLLLKSPASPGGRRQGGVGHGTPPFPAPRAAASKVGRNDPCPCGSGKKYKKCCGR